MECHGNSESDHIVLIHFEHQHVRARASERHLSDRGEDLFCRLLEQSKSHTAKESVVDQYLDHE